MPCRCHCACSCNTTNIYKQVDSSFEVPLNASSERALKESAGWRTQKQWFSYDESDSATVYGFQRKKRFGLKNGSDAVKFCLQWQQQDGLNNEERLAEQWKGVGHRPKHSCKCTNAHEVLLLKSTLNATSRELNEIKAQQQQQAFKQSTQQQRSNNTHVCGCGCTSSCEGCSCSCSSTTTSSCAGCASSCAQASSQQQQQQQCNNSQHEGWNVSSPGAQRPHLQIQHSTSTQQPSPQQPQQQQQQQQQPHEPFVSIVGLPTAQNEISSPGRPSTANASATTKAKGFEASSSRRVRTARPLSAADTAPLPRGTDGTFLMAPHDPRKLHDANNDIVWIENQIAKLKAQQKRESSGQSIGGRNVVDERAYELSNLKQQARRVKMESFQNRFTRQRLQSPPPGTTRDFSETWMGVVTGKPPFAPFGSGNTNPVNGGLVYGDYLLSHNVSPEKKPNHPNRKQTYDDARQFLRRKKRENKKAEKRLKAQLTGTNNNNNTASSSQPAPGRALSYEEPQTDRSSTVMRRYEPPTQDAQPQSARAAAPTASVASSPVPAHVPVRSPSQPTYYDIVPTVPQQIDSHHVTFQAWKDANSQVKVDSNPALARSFSSSSTTNNHATTHSSLNETNARVVVPQPYSQHQQAQSFTSTHQRINAWA